MRSSARVLDQDGARVALPSPTHAVLHNIAHAQLNDHDCLYGRVDLRGLLDLALLSRVHANEIDWDKIARRFASTSLRYALEYHLLWARRLGASVPALGGDRKVSKLLVRRAEFQARNPNLLSLNVRLLRPLVLLHRELSDAGLRHRLRQNLLRRDWWKRHLKMLTDT